MYLQPLVSGASAERFRLHRFLPGGTNLFVGTIFALAPSVSRVFSTLYSEIVSYLLMSVSLPPYLSSKKLASS